MIWGCTVEEISEADSVARLFVEKKVPTHILADDSQWLLIHQDDGVIWGMREGNEWKLSSDIFPSASPPPLLKRVQQIRAFGESEEMLLWRAGDCFRGRIAREDTIKECPSWGSAIDESFILVADRVLQPEKEGFTLVGNQRGSKQAIPIACTNEELQDRKNIITLSIRHFPVQDPETGCVRIALSRLVKTNGGL